MNLWTWLTRWRRQSVPPDVYVVCEMGVPVVVCADQLHTEKETRRRPRAVTRVYQVPLIKQGRE